MKHNMIIDEQNNQINEHDSGAKIRFYPSAKNCTVTIGPNCKLENFQIHLYAHNLSVSIGEGNSIRGDIYMKVANATVSIGRNNSIKNNIFMNVGGSITIGDNCLFAAVKFRSTDSHRIYDEVSGQQINPDSPIVVGNRIWLAEDVLLLGGAEVGDDCVVGARSMVTGKIAEKSLAVGIPARVVRTGIRWEE